jgi:hypothetical protein
VDLDVATLKAVSEKPIVRARAMPFIVLIGVFSLLADMTYEDARSVTDRYHPP